MQVYQAIAAAIIARHNCENNGNAEWQGRHEARLEWLARECLPSGSGFDAGTTIDHDRSNTDRLVFLASFHHMDEVGGYDGWTEHTVTIKPTFMGFDIAVGGRDRNGIKDYIADTFDAALRADVPAHYEQAIA